MTIKENIRLALYSLKSNFLRTSLTLMIIAVGITCLVGMLTAIDSILFSMNDSFNRLGTNSFQIRPLRENIQSHNDGKATKRAEPIVFKQAQTFKDNYRYGTTLVSINELASRSVEVSFLDKKTNPTVTLRGVDENFFTVSNYNLSHGRNFTLTEVSSGASKCIIGMDLVDQLFEGNPERAIGKNISINAGRYKVIGVLESKGSSFGGNNDRQVFVSLTKSKQLYGYARKNYNLIVGVTNPVELDAAINAAYIPLRNIRNLSGADPNDFEIRKSDSVLNTLKDITKNLRFGTIAIALLTLLGASIGLMNIMLVSVTERTREIGVSKALGAKRSNILIQFLTEAVVITQVGGVVGVFLGVIIGNFVSIWLKSPFIMPWEWILLAFFVCLFVGVVSGLYPALKASRLDPIESLRYE